MKANGDKLSSALNTISFFSRITLVVSSGVLMWVDRIDWAILFIAWATYLKVCAYVEQGSL